MSADGRHTCPPDHAHDDDRNCYSNHKCRCEACIHANSEYAYYRRHMLEAGRWAPWVSSLGTARRLQALAYMGYSSRDVAERIGAHQQDVSRWRYGKTSHIARATDKRIRALFDTIWDKPGSSNRAKREAVRKGWESPLAWDDIDDPNEKPHGNYNPSHPERAFDEVAVDQALHGLKPHLMPLETQEVVRVLHGRMWSDGLIAEHIGMTVRTIERTRSNLGLAAWTPQEAERKDDRPY